MVNDISELQSALTDGKALYHKKDYNVAIQKIENILGSASNKRLLSEVYSPTNVKSLCSILLIIHCRRTYCWQNATKDSVT